MADIDKIKLPNDTTYNIKDTVARLAGVYYGVCETSGSTADKDVTISGITSLYDGLQISVKFVEACTVASARLSVNNLGYKYITRTRTGVTASGEWYSGAVLNLVYYSADSAGANDGWRIVNGGIATTSFYGRTKLSSAVNSTSSTEAATPSAVKQAYDLAASKPDLEDVVPVYGQGKNLLHNWYFIGGGTGRGVFPVNQRGQSSYSSGYSIDRWRISSEYYTAALSSTGITLTKTSGGAALFGQKLSGLDLNQTYTFSAIVNGTLCIYTGEFDGNYLEFTVDGVKFRLYMILDTNKPEVRIYCTTATAGVLTITAVKLELGTEQTLAHNEGTTENPVWILNEIPDYEEELIKC